MKQKPVRWELVRRIRRQIARGEYVTQEKLEATAKALERVLRGNCGRSTSQGS